MTSQANSVYSNQIEPHEDLEKVIESYKRSEYRKPFAKHTVDLFHKLCEKGVFEGGPLILDLGCGTGKSSIYLANKFRNCFVLGVDKSEIRLSKHKVERENLRVVRADMVDLVRLMKNNGIKTELTTLFYPNPWPKKHQFKRRIHAHPFFGDLLSISSKIWHRTNWDLLNLEFSQAYRFWTEKEIQISLIPREEEAVTDFEKKYKEARQELWQAKNF